MPNAIEELKVKLKGLGLEPVSGSFGRTTESMVSSFEQDLSIKLPEIYRWFLVNYGSSAFAQDVAFAAKDPSLMSENNAESIDFFLGLVGKFDIRSHSMVMDGYPGLLPIAEAAGGNFVCIDISSSKSGRVLFLNHEADRPVTLIADSFRDFLLSAYEEERAYTDEDIDGIELELDDDLE